MNQGGQGKEERQGGILRSRAAAEGTRKGTQDEGQHERGGRCPPGTLCLPTTHTAPSRRPRLAGEGGGVAWRRVRAEPAARDGSVTHTGLHVITGPRPCRNHQGTRSCFTPRAHQRLGSWRSCSHTAPPRVWRTVRRTHGNTEGPPRPGWWDEDEGLYHGA